MDDVMPEFSTISVFRLLESSVRRVLYCSVLVVATSNVTETRFRFEKVMKRQSCLFYGTSRRVHHWSARWKRSRNGVLNLVAASCSRLEIGSAENLLSLSRDQIKILWTWVADWLNGRHAEGKEILMSPFQLSSMLETYNTCGRSI